MGEMTLSLVYLQLQGLSALLDAYWFEVRIRACSHEPGTVNYPGVIIAPGQALPRVHMMICCPGATSPRVNLGQVHSHLITTNFFSFLHKLLQRISLKNIYLFLVLSGTFIGEFIPNINNEHAQDYSCPGATFAFCSHGEKLPRQGGLPGVVQRVTRLSPGSVSCPGAMSCPGIMWTGP